MKTSLIILLLISTQNFSLFAITDSILKLKSDSTKAQITISSDRPTVSYSSTTVPKHSVQIESGFGFETSNNEYIWIHANSDILIRFGLSERIEFRFYNKLNLSNTKLNWHTDIDTRSFSLPDYGFKFNLLHEKKFLPEIAFLPTFVFKYKENDNLNISLYNLDLAFSFTKSLSNRFSAGYNFIFISRSHSLVTSVNLIDNLQLFLEYSRMRTRFRRLYHNLIIGTSYQPISDINVDLSVQFNTLSPSLTINSGFSILMNK